MNAQYLSSEIEGTWDEIAKLAPQFNGHRLRVTILPKVSPIILGAPVSEVIAYLQARLHDEATDDPEKILAAQQELDEMKQSMNAERFRSGAEPIFP